MNSDPEIVYLGTQLKESLARTYASRGAGFGLRMARRWVGEIGAIVKEIDGAEAAATMLFNATDAMVRDVPIRELSIAGTPIVRSDQIVANQRSAAWRAVLAKVYPVLWGVALGLLWAKPVYWLFSLLMP